MKIFLFILSLFILKVSNSQNQYLKSYYKLINKAELFLINSDFENSYKSYEAAFKLQKTGFSSDYFNAALVSAQLGKFDKTLYCFKQLAKLGLDPTCFKQKSMLKQFWESKYGKQAEELDHTTFKTYNKEYRSIIFKMVERDQYFRHFKNPYVLYKDTINSIDRENVNTLLKLINRFGFPSEKLTGLNKNELGLPVLTIIIHQNFRPDRTYDFSDILKRAILTGDLKNTDGSYYIEGNSGKINAIYNPYSLMRASYDTLFEKVENGSAIKKDTTFYTKWGYSRIPESKVLEIESNRKNLMLDSLSEALRKDVFRLTKFSEFDLGSPDSGVTWRRVKFSEFLYMKEHLLYIQ